ncbi:nuclear transport factor 2 family protein [Rhodococcus koreensis]
MTLVDQDTLEIRTVVENWAVWRDAGDWDRFATVWHEDGYMTATWFQGTAVEFIAVSRKGFDNGVRILHFLGGTSVDVHGDRAVAQTKMTINQRAEVHGLDADVVCTGRFYDFFEKRNRDWKIVRRQPIYEKDRFDLVDPAATLTLDAELLQRFPIGYRHLAYLQTNAGFEIKTGLPGLIGDAVETLYDEGRAWLDGAPTPGIPL